MDLSRAYESHGLEEFDVFVEDDATIWLTLTVGAGTFSIALTPRIASEMGEALKRAAS